MNRPVAAAVVLAFLAGCAVETVRDVATLKDLVEARDLDAIVAFEVDCAAGAPGCSQAHMIKADACLRRAQGVGVGERAPFAACAAEAYASSRTAAAVRPDPLVDPARLARWELEALRFWRDAVAAEEGALVNVTLAERAERVATGQPGRPEGLYYLADARIWTVNLGVERPPCPGVAAAMALAERAAPLRAAGDVDVEQLQQDLQSAARAFGCDILS